MRTCGVGGPCHAKRYRPLAARELAISHRVAARETNRSEVPGRSSSDASAAPSVPAMRLAIAVAATVMVLAALLAVVSVMSMRAPDVVPTIFVAAFLVALFALIGLVVTRTRR